MCIDGRLTTNFRFADGIVVNAEEEEEAGILIDRLNRTTTRYKVENFKYLGAIISNEGSKPEILSRIAQTTVALSRLKIIWRDKNISLASKVKLMRSLHLIYLPLCL